MFISLLTSSPCSPSGAAVHHRVTPLLPGLSLLSTMSLTSASSFLVLGPTCGQLCHWTSTACSGGWLIAFHFLVLSQELVKHANKFLDLDLPGLGLRRLCCPLHPSLAHPSSCFCSTTFTDCRSQHPHQLIFNGISGAMTECQNLPHPTCPKPRSTSQMLDDHYFLL